MPSNGGEVYNRRVEQMLAMFVNEQWDNWYDHHPYTMIAYRASVQDSTGCPLNLLFLGREFTLLFNLMACEPPLEGQNPPPCPVEYVEWIRQASDFRRSSLLVKFFKLVWIDRNDCMTDNRMLHEVGDCVWWWFSPQAKQKLGKKVSHIT